MNQHLKKLKDIKAKACVTIILNTHRTHPDNLQDGILLKNLQKEAEARLLDAFDKRFAQPIIDRISTIADGLNHDYNLDSLVIFANENMADFVRLPIAVEDRVVLDQTFATRDLVRAMHQTESYYVLVLSRDKTRLIEATSDKVVGEVTQGVFPIHNRHWTTDKLEQSMKDGSDNLIEEYFNRVDKALKVIRSQNPLPVLLATEERNVQHYLKVADDKSILIGQLHGNYVEDKAHHLVEQAWPVVLAESQTRNEARIAELKQAVSTGKFLSDFNDIWSAVNSGQAKTLFATRNYFQPAILKADNSLEIVAAERAVEFAVVDDIFHAAAVDPEAQSA